MKSASTKMLPILFPMFLIIFGNWFAVAGKKITFSESVEHPGFVFNAVDSKSLKRFVRAARNENAKMVKHGVRRSATSKNSQNNGLIDASNLMHLDPSSMEPCKAHHTDCFTGPARRCLIRVKNVTNIEYIYGDDFSDRTARNMREPDGHLYFNYWTSANLERKLRFESCFPPPAHIDPADSETWNTRCWKDLVKERTLRMYGGVEQRIERSWYRLAAKASLFSPDYESIRNWPGGNFPRDAIENFPSNVKRLHIDGGKIKVLKKGYLKNKYIFELDLHDHNIWKIEDGAIVMPQLVNLTLSGNRLNKIKLLPPLPSGLRTLALAANGIRKVPSGSFSNLKHLNDLILSENQIINITIGAFKYLVELEWLDLTGNRISSLDPGVFKELVNLRYLILRDNKLSIIHPEVLDLPQLTALDISRNNIIYIIKGTFGKAGNLCFLEISENSVTELGNGVLFGMKTHYPCNAVVWRLPLKTIAGGVFDDV